MSVANGSNSVLSVAQTADVLKDVIRVFGSQDDERALRDALGLAQKHLNNLHGKRSRLEEQRQALRRQVAELNIQVEKYTDQDGVQRLEKLRKERDSYIQKIDHLKAQEIKVSEEYHKTQNILLKLTQSHADFDNMFFLSLSHSRALYSLYREISGFVFLDHDFVEGMKGSIHLSNQNKIIAFEYSSESCSDFEATNQIWDILWTNYDKQ